MFRVMVLSMWRDRPALIMTFVLPSAVFLIFSAAFSGAGGLNLGLKVEIADLAGSNASARLASALLADKELRASLAAPPAPATLRRDVLAGRADAGIAILQDAARPGPAVMILSDPARAAAAPIAEAAVRQALQRATPDALLARTVGQLSPALGALTPAQRQDLAIAEAELASNPAAGQPSPLVVREAVRGSHSGAVGVAYYAGAVMILFALFSSAHSALTLVDERRTGVADRILAGRAGMAPVVNGKMAYLVLQAVVQAAVVFATAQLVYGVPVIAHGPLWLVTTIAAAIASAGLALAVVSLCRTREQAQMVSTFLILVLAAVGGSMAPRFLMPPWLQNLGWFTPHAWVIEAYEDLLWRDAGAGELYKAWVILALAGAAGLAIAQWAARRTRA